MKKVIFILVLFISFGIAEINLKIENAIPADKFQHTVLNAIAVDYQADQMKRTKKETFESALFWNATKEVVDYFVGGTPDINDFIWGMIGWFVGSMINYPEEKQEEEK